MLFAALKTFDIYGQTINLNYGPGKQVHKTALGGAVSILFWTLLLSFAVVRTVKMAQLDDPDVYEVTTSIDLS
jgi:hypothetical protein